MVPQYFSNPAETPPPSSDENDNANQAPPEMVANVPQPNAPQAEPEREVNAPQVEPEREANAQQLPSPPPSPGKFIAFNCPRICSTYSFLLKLFLGSQLF